MAAFSLTDQETADFFEERNQMAMEHETVVALVDEGIDNVEDLAEIYKDSMEQIARNLRGNFTFGAKSMMRLIVACDLVRYYDTVARPMTVDNMKWSPVMKNFDFQWKALKDKKEAAEPETPKITKTLTIMRWSEAFRDALYQCVGVRTIPLVYVIRDDPSVPPAVPALEQGYPHSTQHGSVEEELIHRASHNHPLFREDNQKV